MRQEFSFGVIPLRKIEEGVSILLIFHKGGRHWSFPKGHQDPGETDLETASRELKEETNLDIVEYLSKDPYVESYTFYKLHEKILKTVSYYPAFVSGDLKLQPEEILDARWLSIEEALYRLTFKEAKAICQKVAELCENWEGF